VQGGAGGDAVEEVGGQFRLGAAGPGHRAGAGDETAVVVEVVAEGDGAAGVAAVAGDAHAAQGGAFGDRLPLQLGDAAQELEHEPADGRAGVERLGGGTDGDAGRIERVMGADQGLERAAQPVEAVHEHDAELPRLGVCQQAPARGALRERQGTADAVIDVLGGDGEADHRAVAAQEVALRLDGLPLRLLVGADPAVEGDGGLPRRASGEGRSRR
jgi:hypothetical protein